MTADEQKLEQPIKVQLSDDEDAVVQTEGAPKVATKVGQATLFNLGHGSGFSSRFMDPDQAPLEKDTVYLTYPDPDPALVTDLDPDRLP